MIFSNIPSHIAKSWKQYKNCVMELFAFCPLFLSKTDPFKVHKKIQNWSI